MKAKVFFTFFVGLTLVIPLLLIADDRPVGSSNKQSTRKSRQSVRSQSKLSGSTSGDRQVSPFQVDSKLLTPGIVATIPRFLVDPTQVRVNDDDDRPFWEIHVDSSNRIEERTRKIREDFAKHFRKITTVPPDRLRFWSAIDPGLGEIVGWRSMVQSVAEIPGGSIVTLSVVPRVSSDPKINFAYSGYSEVYFVDTDTQITYRGFNDPYHNLGKPPFPVTH